MKKKTILIIGLALSILLSNLTFVYADGGYKKGYAARHIANSEKINITKENIKYEKEYYSVQLEIPVINGLSDKEYQRKLNSNIRNNILSRCSSFELEAKEAIEEAKRQGRIPLNMEYISKYDYKNSHGVLTVIVETYSFTGGANGMSKNYYYNILIDENETIQLSELFKPGNNYREIINDEIERQIVEREKSGEVFYEGKDGFDTIADNHDFYIDEDNLVLTFPMYSIAPRQMGIVEFEIPLYKINYLLKKPLSIVNNNIYYNYKYDFQFRMSNAWMDNVYINEYYDTTKARVDFIYSPKDSKYADHNLMTIFAIDRNTYYKLNKDEKNKMGSIIIETEKYVYLYKTYENPYYKNTKEYKEYKKLSVEINAKTAFKLGCLEKDKIKNVKNYKWVIINGKKENLGKDMYINENGVLMLPLRKAANKLGYKVKWNPQDFSVTLNINGKISTVFIDEYDHGHFNTVLRLNKSAEIKSGTVFVPITYFENELELQIKVNSDGILIINE